MNDDQASACIDAVLNLAVVIRDEGPDAILTAAREVLALDGADALSAIAVAAALIQIDHPVDQWWDSPRHAARRPLAPCGTRHALLRHRLNGEPIDAACIEAERRYFRARRATERSQREEKPPPVFKPCGTHAAYERHKRRGEQIDDACRRANSAYKTGRAKARAGRAAA